MYVCMYVYVYMIIRQLIATCYFLNGGDPVSNPLISPAIASNEILSQFPPIYGHVGSVDPLVDDVLRFGARVVQANPNNKVELAIIPKVSHAYMHVVTFLPEAKLAVDLSAQWLANILDKQVPKDIIDSLPERMKKLGFTITDCRDYELKQPKSRAQKEAAAATAAASSSLVSKL
jgi:hypothetical protein